MGNFSKLIQSKTSNKQEGEYSKTPNPSVQLKDNRPENAFQLKLSEIVNSKRAKIQVQLAAMKEDELQMKGIEEDELQMKGIEEEELQMKEVEEEELQLKGIDEKELQMKSTASPIKSGLDSGPGGSSIQRVENNTGLPDQLKSGVESLSGYSLDDVKVHYNSDKPAQLNAHAYAQGTNIHVALGQEKHLPHEAWHVVQQKQGRVKPTRQMKGKVIVNDDRGLEAEADRMGAKAIQTMPDKKRSNSSNEKSGISALPKSQLPIQRNEESTEVLKDLAEPKVGQQDIELSKKIHDQIEQIYKDTIDKDYRSGHYNGAVCLGGIILPSLQQYDNLGSLVGDCEFVNLGKGAVKRGMYELLSDGLKKELVLNTLQTMYDADQLDYLWYSKFGGKKKSGWKVVVEVHYYRSRESSDNVFHKDTSGKTLFVNLNYLNKKKIVGPEYIVNPPDNSDHLKKIAKTLPKEFLKDRDEVMSELKDPQIIEVVEVPEYGYVAFVDEIIHHSSPTTQHRKAKGESIQNYLLSKDKDAFNVYSDAFKKWGNRSIWKKGKKLKNYVEEKYKEDASDWQSFLSLFDSNSSYDRNEIRTMDPAGKLIGDDIFEEMLHRDNYKNFGQVSIPNPEDINNPFRSPLSKADKPLKRRMSVNLDAGLMGTTEKEVDGRRSFFRTWVRAEKQDAQVTRDDWTWTQV